MMRTDSDENDSTRNTTADRAEHHRRVSDEQFNQLMAHLQQVFWIKNVADDAVIYVSPQYETIFGRSCQSLYEDFDSFLEAIHPLDRPRVAAVIAGQNITLGYEQEYRIVRPDGELRWIWARSYPVRDAQGRIIRFAGIAEDVTARKELEKDKAQLAAIVEYSEDAIVSMSVDCVIIAWNRGAERQYGYTAEEIIGCSLSVLFPPDRYAEYLQTLSKVRRGEPVSSCDTVRQKKDGTLIKTAVSIFPIEVRNNEVVGASKISRDVTALKKLEDQFIEAQKMEVVGQIAAGVTHDFNNLLFVILGCTELMMSDSRAQGVMRGWIETIREATTSASVLIRQLLCLSRTEETDSVALDLNDVVEDLTSMMRQFVDDNIELTIFLGRPIGKIRGNASHLGQLLLNLVINARDAMPCGGRLVVSTTRVESCDGCIESVKLAVSDTGTGMSGDVAARVFEPFFTTKRKGHGTGLGLATCNNIVKQHGGQIAVRSAPGQGSTFEVLFPAVREQEVNKNNTPGKT